MDIATRKTDQITVISLQGAVDLYSSPEARKTVLGSIKDGKPKLVLVELSGVSYIDSSGVATLVEGLQLAKEFKCDFYLVGLSQAAKEVFELARLDKVFSIFPSEKEAVEKFGTRK
jgi:anti-sigma B factor antagonist